MVAARASFFPDGGTERLEALLLQLVGEVAALREEVRGLRDDRDRASADEESLLNEIAGQVRAGEMFTAAHLVAISQVEDELRQALSLVVGNGAHAARRLGKVFQRLQDRPCGLWRLRRAGVDREGAQWTLEAARE